MAKESTKKTNGRPSKYDPMFISSVDDYLSSRTDSYDEKKLTVSLPTVEDFAGFIGVNKTTLYEWSKVQPDFSNALSKILTEQQNRLINKGLSNEYNPTIAKLILSSNHGMREKSDTDITTGGEKMNSVLVRFLDGKDNGRA